MWRFVYKGKQCLAQLLSYAVLLIVLILSLTSRTTLSQRLVSYPCSNVEAIKWVRHPHFCDQYYICHFGQPLSMPACPRGQVWGQKALNCVPEGSSWDDCFPRPFQTQQQNSLTPTQPITRRQDWKTHSTSRPRLLRGSPRYHRQNGRFPSKRQRMQKKNYVDEKNNFVDPLQRVDVKQPQRVKSIFATKTPLQSAEFPESWKTDSLDTSRSLPDTTTNQHVVIEWYTTTRPPTNTSVIRNRNNYVRPKWRRPHDKRRKTLRSKKGETKQIHLDRLRQTVATDHVCMQQPGALLPHPDMCHWYYNCSLHNLDDVPPETDDEEEEKLDDNKEGFIRLEPYRVRKAGVFVWECRYPQLFDDVTHQCREFLNVKCGNRFEPVDQCEYSFRECRKSKCVPTCDQRFGRCRGKENGIYPLPSSHWTSVFVSCYMQRNIAQDECQPPSPIFSPEKLDCVSLYEVPKRNGGLLPDCGTRPDGYYPDEQGRCAIFFRCSIGQFRGYDSCPLGSVFDPAIPACQPFSLASKPCGEGQAPLCGGKLNGLYADPYGRCTHFFQCKDGLFQRYYSCDSGIFDPHSQRCITDIDLVMRPCGLKPNPCETLPTGVYPDQVTGCKHFIECHHGIMVTNGTCDRGQVFSAITGRCDLPENTPPPCGFATTCSDRPDGRYPALNRGCSFFYECYHGQFISLRRCTAADGGFFFNPGTGKCDYPQNICPPCGYRWWGCSSYDYLT